MLSSNRGRCTLPQILAIPIMLALALVAEPLSAQLPPGSVCWGCVDGCRDGLICDGVDDGTFGSNDCAVGDGPVAGRCHCFPSGGVCEGFAQAPDEMQSAEDEALAVFAAGGTLPANGPFYTASRGEHLVLRRKCDDELVGRMAVAEAGAASRSPEPLSRRAG